MNADMQPNEVNTQALKKDLHWRKISFTLLE